MGRRKITAFVLLALLCSGIALADDTGLQLSLAADKKISKKFGLDIEAEFRSRNDFRTVDRFAVAFGADYKPLKWLKADISYQFIVKNNQEKITFNPDGNYNNWRPSFYGTRHRFNVSLTASYRLGRVNFSLRERYRFTYRPPHKATRYDFDNAMWEDVTVSKKHNHTLRSRLKIAYDIPRSKFQPWTSFELFNDIKLCKTRFQVGLDYTIRKQHEFSVYYQYQYIAPGDDDEDDLKINSHMLGLGYTFKF